QTMPNEMGYDYLGISYQEKKAQQGVSPTMVFGMSLIFVFLILAALYESWSLPFSVLLGTPVAVLGAFLTLWLRGMENNIYAHTRFDCDRGHDRRFGNRNFSDPRNILRD